ncbi:GNAT family N-acetyltransferase [Jidongwangia harbinensis]|uniref:GNAT family N-acetyltransferase n=1 Tax=Jidongwangia harbinensis TaxID=2878561 RepID=UPI001CD95A07|nr:GNAT family N-acetyltransferase [Jidongwangia harbinensis]MCA2214681.1 GNAT family N-acetyltransferase [Jidongwangia harbinensis]
MAADTDFWLEAWDGRGLTLEHRANIPSMKTYLGGTETEDSIVARHRRILAFTGAGTGRMFLILVPGVAEPVGSVGYWERQWQGDTVYEMGWKVLPGHQGRGLARAATVTALGFAAAVGRCRWAHAYPKVGHAASDAVCRTAGFELLGECDFEYPAGHPIRCHDWRYDLATLSASVAGSGSVRRAP